MADNIFDTVAPTPRPAAAQPRSSNIFDSPAPAAAGAAPDEYAQWYARAPAIERATHISPSMEKASSTVLRRAGDVMESFTYAPALGIGYTHPGRPSYADMMGRAFYRLSKGDWSGFSDVASEYGFGTPAENEYLAHHSPSPLDRAWGQFMLDHPKVNAAATFGVEWENPANKLMPGIARGAGKTVAAGGRLAAKIPVVGPAGAATFAKHTAAVSDFFNRFGRLEKAGGAPAVQAAMQIVSEKNAVPANARPLIQEIFGYGGARGAIDGLSKAQHYEIGRLSQRKARDPAVPDAAHGLSLQERGVKLRALLKQLDMEQSREGLLPKGRTFDSETYIPMQPELTYAEHAAPVSESGRQAGATFSGRVRKGTSAPGKSKVYLDLDQVRAGENPAQFAEAFDLAENVRQHYVQRMQNVIIERGIRRFESILNPEAGAMVRPLLYRLTRGNAMEMFGEGAYGYKKSRLWAAAEAHRMAKLKAAEEAGLARAPREAPTGQLIGKRTETAHSTWRLSKLAQDALSMAARTHREATKAIPGLSDEVGLGPRIEAKKVAPVDPELSADEHQARADLTDLISQHTQTVPGLWRTVFGRSMEGNEHLVPERYQEPAYRPAFGVYKSGGRFVFKVNDPESVDPAVVEQARALFVKAGYDKARYGFTSGAGAEKRAGGFLKWLGKYYKTLPIDLTPEAASKAYDYARNMRQGIEGLPKRQRYSRVNEGRTQKIDAGVAALQAYMQAHGIGSAPDITAKVRAERATRGTMGATPTETAPSVLSRMSKKERERYENQREATLRAIRRPAAGMAGKVGRAATDSLERIAKLDKQLSERRVNNETAQLVKQVARGMEKEIRRKLWHDAVEESHPEPGHKLAIDQRGAPLLDSPYLRKKTVDEALFRFLRDDLGAPAESASILSRYWNTLNALARVGIVSNPIIHPTWNLGFMFLAAGGDLSFFNPLSKRSLFHESDPDWAERADRNSANFTFSQGVFGLSGQHEATVLTAGMHELGTLGKMDKVASAAWRANQHLVFTVFERRYATELFRQLVERFGKTDAEAGILTRKALGDYTNLTRQERLLNHLFFFYPWMKTVVPFWAKKSLEAPQWWNAPSRAVANYNASVGDKGTSNPFSVALGDKTYYTPMLPQRVLNPMAQLATTLTPGAGEDVLTGHLEPAANYLVGHLNPFIASMVDLWSTMQEPAQKPGFYTIVDKDAPAGTFWKQLGIGTLGQFVYPFREGRGIFEGISKGHYAPLLGVVPGGFATVEDPDALIRADNAIRRKYEPAIRNAADPLIKQALKRKLQEDLDTLDRRYGGAP